MGAGGRFPFAGLVAFLEYDTGQMLLTSATASGLYSGFVHGEGSVWLTTGEIADRVGVPVATVSKWSERGMVPADRVDEICGRLNIHPVLVWPYEWMVWVSCPPIPKTYLPPEHEAAHRSGHRHGKRVPVGYHTEHQAALRRGTERRYAERRRLQIAAGQHEDAARALAS